jgi:hypothetical protein
LLGGLCTQTQGIFYFRRYRTSFSTEAHLATGATGIDQSVALNITGHPGLIISIAAPKADETQHGRFLYSKMHRDFPESS